VVRRERSRSLQLFPAALRTAGETWILCSLAFAGIGVSSGTGRPLVALDVAGFDLAEVVLMARSESGVVIAADSFPDPACILL
jgi:hypothetical protein